MIGDGSHKATGLDIKHVQRNSKRMKATYIIANKLCGDFVVDYCIYLCRSIFNRIISLHIEYETMRVTMHG